MADEPKPTLEEPKGESTGEVGSTQNVDVGAVMKELEAIGTTTPESVRNMHHASTQAGRYANEIGELRQEVERLRMQGNTPQPPQTTPYDDYNTGESVDLGNLIEKKMIDVWGKIQHENNAAYQRQMQEIGAIQSDEDFHLVKDIWEEYTKSPNVGMRVNSGQSSWAKEYDKVVRGYFRGVAKRSKEALEIATKQGGRVTPPHFESGTPPAPPQEAAEDTKDTIRKIASKTSGSDDDIDAMIGALLPEGDAILPR